LSVLKALFFMASVLFMLFTIRVTLMAFGLTLSLFIRRLRQA
jgi:hypothetical protein